MKRIIHLITGRAFRMVIRVIFRIGLTACMFLLLINLWVMNRYRSKIVEWTEVENTNIDCIMVLGAGVWSDGQPSYMLRDRLDRGINLYELQVSERLLMSGDHGRIAYDEVNVMKDYAVGRGVDPNHVFMDHAGFSTYESMVRAKEVFCVESMVIVTQEYHLYRAVFIANSLGIDAYGVAANTVPYRNQWMREMREAVARAKDSLFLMFDVPPKYLGEAIPISGSGASTDDR